MKFFFLPNSIRLYQPLFKISKSLSVYESEYVKKNSMDYGEGIGDIFQESDAGVFNYPKIKSTNWLPNFTYRYEVCANELFCQALDFQVYSHSFYSLDNLSRERNKKLKKQWSDDRKTNELIKRATKKAFSSI